MQKSTKNSLLVVGGSFVLLFALILKGLPIINGILITFKNYSLPMGVVDSPYVGFSNIKKVLTSFHFPNILFNTVRLNVIYLVLVLAVGILLAISLLRVSKLLQNVFLTLILIPLFIPANVFVHISFVWFKGTLALTREQLFPYIYALLLTIKNVGLPTLFILKTLQMKKRIIENNGFRKIMPAVAFIMAQLTFILSTDMDIINNIINPLVYATGDTLDYSIYRLGFMQMNSGEAMSIWLIQLVLQLIIGFVSYLLLSVITTQSSSKAINDNTTLLDEQRTNPVGVIIPLLYILFIAFFVFKPLLVDGLIGLFSNTMLLQGSLLSSFAMYILVYGLIALITVPISVPMAKSILANRGFGVVASIILVFLFIADGMGIHQYLFIRDMGLINTMLSFVPYYIIPITNSLVLAVILYYHKSSTGIADESSQQLTNETFTWKVAFTLGVIQFIKMWNSELVPLVFISQREKMPPILLSRMLSQGMNAGGVDLVSLMGMDLLISIIPVSLFLVFKKYINEWIILAYIKNRY